MSRASLVPTLLGALATGVLALPLRPLFTDDSWLHPALLGVLVVALSGLVLRALTPRTGIVIAGQALLALLYLVHAHLGSTTTYGLPRPSTVELAVQRFTDAQTTISSHAAPAPTTPGVAFMLGVIVVLVALAVDLAAATAESPAIAGIPLFSLFLVSAANSDGTLHDGWFVAGAGLWLLLLGHRAHQDTARWTTVVPLLPEQDARTSTERHLGRQALRVGALALAASVLLPGVLPHLPQRYVLDGLGSRAGIGSAGGGDLSLSTELDLRRNLESPSTEPVLRYRTDDPTPEPLRVAVVDRIDGGRVTMSTQAPQRTPDFPVPDLLGDVSESVARETRRMSVVENRIAAPQLPAPARPTKVDVGGTPFSVSGTGTVSVEVAPDRYTVESAELTPEPEDFPTDPNPSGGKARLGYLALDPRSQSAITRLADSLAPSDATPLEVAQGIQEHLRGPGYTYSLELAPRTEPEDDDAVLHFLRTRTGYCQQFATTMVLLSRARGIPARLAVGFQAGTTDGDERVVRANDAHAWPELFFDGVGWVRFEPTPGSDAPQPPGYSVPGAGEGEDPETSSEPTSSSSSSSSSSRADQPTDDTAVTPTGGGSDDGSSWWRWPLLVLLGTVAVLAIMPLSAIAARRRRRAAADDEAARVEREWQELVSRLGDLGVEPPVGATPRQAGTWLATRLSLPPDQRDRLGHVVSTLERARYAPPGQQLPDVGADVDRLVGHARGTRQTGQRVRAVLWPRDGVDAWRALGTAVLDRVTGLLPRSRR